ncbi:ATP-binding cassette domain-containing protein [Brachybacterium sp. AOP25-B2-12]|uniref:ATP-binding cassette domain-containing protein n=1 Tax=Brachybacterium sp. AOP25-B2-12 TaxID=3457710 RepID=UPI004033BA12
MTSTPGPVAETPEHGTSDAHDVIRVRGARVNNLRGVDVDIPKRRLTVVTGVSGSGKSSLVFGTIAAESQRLINETYSTFVQTFMPSAPRPEVDELANLTTAIVVDQNPLGANARSTVGTATDAYALLRTLYSRCSVPHVGSSQAFAFNVASASGAGVLRTADGKAEKKTFEVIGGMCPSCEGTGRTSTLDVDVIVDRSKTLNDGAILLPGHPVGSWQWRSYAETGRLDPDVRVADYTEEQWHWLYDQEPTKIKFAGMNYTYQGLASRVRRSYLDPQNPPKQKHIQEFAARVATYGLCPECHGTRLAEKPRTAVVGGKRIWELTAMQVTDLLTWVQELDEPSVAPLLVNLTGMLRAIIDIGLGYLSLDRESGTLSGGEGQRIKMIRHLGSPLTDVTYVFDEPTAGLHPHDISRMNALLLQLRDKGNTVLVVEHKPEVMAVGDLLIDIGPGAGADGGTVLFTGTFDALRATDTATARSLDHRLTLPASVRTAKGRPIEIRGASDHNLRDVDVDLPSGVLTVVTGVAGSGKSSLIQGGLEGRDGVTVIDQGAISGSRRSNPATYTGLLDPIRSAFAKAHGVKPALFSFNSEGACPACKGAGVIYTDLGLMAGTAIPCEVCGGRRFQAEVLEYRLEGLTIEDVLNLSVAQAAEHFTAAKEKKILRRLLDVGLGYLRLGQPLTTLSGGERQRLKLAARMGTGAQTFVLDEPTNGLHLQDVDTLVAMFQRLVDAGSTVIVIEHSPAVMSQADWLIDVGPGAGNDGGSIVFEGTPRTMVEDASVDTLTAQALRAWVQDS